MAALDTLTGFTPKGNLPPTTRYAEIGIITDGDDPTSEIDVLDFDPGATTEFARAKLLMGGQYDGTSALEVVIAWTSEATSGDVKWDVKIARWLQGNTIVTADNYAAVQSTTTTTSGTARVLNKTTIDFTNAEFDGVQPNDWFLISVERDSADGTDTMDSNDAELHGVEVRLN